MKTLTIAILFLTLNLFAQIMPPDLTTVRTNTVSSRGYITIYSTNVYVTGVVALTNSSGVCSNLVITYGTNVVSNVAYFAYNPVSTNYGWSSYQAWQNNQTNLTFITNWLAAINYTATNFMATNAASPFMTNILTATVGGHTFYITNGLVGNVQ